MAEAQAIQLAMDEVEQKKQHLAVIHNNLDDSKCRQCNIIVSGLVPMEGVGDVNLFLEICENNLTVEPLIVQNKRRWLGRPLPGKIQSSLICLNKFSKAFNIADHAVIVEKLTKL
jgi:hypothetical protein